MGYTKAVDFIDGTVLTAADVETNLEGVREYVNKGIVAGDIGTGVIQTQHLRRPELERFGSILEMRVPSGATYTMKQPAIGLSWWDDNMETSTPWSDNHNWPMHYNECFSHPHYADTTDSTTTAVSKYRPVPKLARTFHLDHRSDIFIQWTVKFLCPWDHDDDNRENYFRLFVDDVDYSVTSGTILQHRNDTFDMDVYARVVSGCKLVTGLSAGWHHLWIGAALKARFSFLGVSNMIIEAEYDIT